MLGDTRWLSIVIASLVWHNSGSMRLSQFYASQLLKQKFRLQFTRSELRASWVRIRAASELQSVMRNCFYKFILSCVNVSRTENNSPYETLSGFSEKLIERCLWAIEIRAPNRVAVGRFPPQHRTNTMRFNQKFRFWIESDSQRNAFGAAFHSARTLIRNIYGKIFKLPPHAAGSHLVLGITEATLACNSVWISNSK